MAARARLEARAEGDRVSDATSLDAYDREQMARFRRACARAASVETCYPPERLAWEIAAEQRTTVQLRLFGHCGAVAYAAQRRFGGEVLSGAVDGERWIFNRLPRDPRPRCIADESVAPPARVRPARLTHARFELFWQRVECARRGSPS